MRSSATCSSFVWRATLCRLKSWQPRIRGHPPQDQLFMVLDTKGAGQCRRRSQQFQARR